jgi:quercetin dioxygenase-like cupin family protein
VLKDDATLDIDNDEDFAIAELLLERKKRVPGPPRYWDDEASRAEHAEVEVAGILRRDGVDDIDLEDVNHELLHLPDLLAGAPMTRSWSRRIINSPSNCVTLISQMPGEGNRRHYHSDWDEWWLILEGEWEYEVDGKESLVREGDVVFIQRGRLHKVTAVGGSRAIRMAVSRDDVAHIYPDT